MTFQQLNRRSVEDDITVISKEKHLNLIFPYSTTPFLSFFFSLSLFPLHSSLFLFNFQGTKYQKATQIFKAPFCGDYSLFTENGGHSWVRLGPIKIHQPSPAHPSLGLFSIKACILLIYTISPLFFISIFFKIHFSLTFQLSY